MPIWRRLCCWVGLAGTLAGFALLLLGCGGVVASIWSLIGLGSIIPFIVIWAVGFVGVIGAEGRHNVWAVFGMGARGG
jgi:hypothetical protein